MHSNTSKFIICLELADVVSKYRPRITSLKPKDHRLFGKDLGFICLNPDYNIFVFDIRMTMIK